MTVARFLIEASEGDTFASVTLPVSGVQIAVNNKPAVTEFDFTGVQLAHADLGDFLVFSLTGDAARDVYRLTGNNQGKRLVLFINGKPVGARMIDRAFNTGAIAIFVAIPDDLLPDLVALRLSAEAFERLRTQHPALAAKLLHNISLYLAGRLRGLTVELADWVGR